MRIRQTGLTWNVTGDDVVVLDLDGSVYLKLNGSGRVLWERLASTSTEEELVSTLVDTYGNIDTIKLLGLLTEWGYETKYKVDDLLKSAAESQKLMRTYGGAV